jgi:hypothetical protein
VRGRSAPEVGRRDHDGLCGGRPNQVREVLETHDSPGDVLVALGKFGEFQEQVIDPEIVIDFSAFDSAAAWSRCTTFSPARTPLPPLRRALRRLGGRGAPPSA